MSKPQSAFYSRYDRAPRSRSRRSVRLVFPWFMLFGLAVLTWYGTEARVSARMFWPWIAVLGSCILLYQALIDNSWSNLFLKRLGIRTSKKTSSAGVETGPMEYLLQENNQNQKQFGEYYTSILPFQLCLLLIIVVFCWIYVPLLWINPYQLLGEISNRASFNLSVTIAIYSLLPFRALIALLLRYFPSLLSTKYWWILLGIFIISAIALWSVANNKLNNGVFILIFFIVFGTSWVDQRLWAGDTALNYILREVSLTLLSFQDTELALKQKIPSLIKERLQYDRVFIVEICRDGKTLSVIGQASDDKFPDVIGRTYAIEQDGITTNAIRKRSIIVWNSIDANKGGYINLLRPEDPVTDDTRSEIAIPIINRGEIFGVISVQSPRSGMYGYADRIILGTIAETLGAALSVHRSRELVRRGNEVWKSVNGWIPQLISSQDIKESKLITEFAKFANEELGAAPLIYYALSPSGYPISKPFFIEADLNQPSLMHAPFENNDSMLFQLIRKWEIYTSTDAFNDPDLCDRNGERSRFIEREGVVSTCFVPVGIKEEPLGALFLNYRVPKKFDGLFIHMVQSLSQALASVAWRVRDHYLTYQGFARPELDLHRLIGIHGLKGSISQEVLRILKSSPDKSINPQLLDLAKRTDDFINNARVVSTSIPPNFWNSEMTLNQLIYAHIDSMRQKQIATTLTSDPLVEAENPTVLLAIYRLIIEAINNTNFHGKATAIIIEVIRRSASIYVRIVDDGKGLPKGPELSKSPSGIFFIKEQFKVIFNSEVSVRQEDNGQGTIVEATIPVLPLDIAR